MLKENPISYNIFPHFCFGKSIFGNDMINDRHTDVVINTSILEYKNK